VELQRSLHSGPIDRSRFRLADHLSCFVDALVLRGTVLAAERAKVGVFLSAQGDGVTGCRWLALHHRLIARGRRSIKRWGDQQRRLSGIMRALLAELPENAVNFG
jgi:hypothetical protein